MVEGKGREGGRKGEEEGEKKKKRENDLLSICAVVILEMLNRVNVYTEL